MSYPAKLGKPLNKVHVVPFVETQIEKIGLNPDTTKTLFPYAIVHHLLLVGRVPCVHVIASVDNAIKFDGESTTSYVIPGLDETVSFHVCSRNLEKNLNGMEKFRTDENKPLY